MKKSTSKKLLEAASKFNQVNEQMKKLKKELDSIKTFIKSEVTEDIAVGEYEIMLKEVQRMILDQELLKEALGENLEPYKKESWSQQLKITRVG